MAHIITLTELNKAIQQMGTAHAIVWYGDYKVRVVWSGPSVWLVWDHTVPRPVGPIKYTCYDADTAAAQVYELLTGIRVG